MNEKYSIEEQCRKILEENGGVIADKARTILLEDPTLKDLKPPLEFISKNWRDPLTPAMMSLSCEAVGGQPDETYEAALAMSLMNLSFYIWDDIIDEAQVKLFKPTLFGKFGKNTALIIGGLATAKAFSILNNTEVDKEKLRTIYPLFWRLWAKMSQIETATLKLRDNRDLSSKKKFWKIKTEAVDMETCMKIGAIIGNGLKNEVKNLGKYGQFLGIILEIWKDFHVSVNLTLELKNKIGSGALPYSLLWASEHSEKIQRDLAILSKKNKVEQSQIRHIVKGILETKVLDKTIKEIKGFAEKGQEALIEMNSNKATRSLQLFLEAQPKLFIESTSLLREQ
jgi:geranylgeranyl diphosphate synthase type I